jgi:hypothetical protein
MGVTGFRGQGGTLRRTLGDCQGGELIGERIEALCVIHLTAELVHTGRRNARADVAPGFPHLVFKIRAEAHRAGAFGSWTLAELLGEGPAGDGRDRAQLSEDGCAGGVRV